MECLWEREKIVLCDENNNGATSAMKKYSETTGIIQDCS
jgi:hypothetical protein